MIYNFDSLKFDILTVEKVEHRDGKFKVKERPYAALSIRLNGSSNFNIDGKIFTALTGDLVYIPADKFYEVEYSGSEFIVVHLMDCNYTEAELITTENKDSVTSLFLKMLEHWKETRSINKANSYLYAIMYKLEEEQNNSLIKKPEEFEKCIKFLNENFSNTSVKIETLCEYGYISRSSLQRYFLKYMGVAPKQYLLQLRLDKAIDLLANDNKPISEIAADCGFSDEKYFSRAFKANFGFSPSDARHRTHI